MEIDLELYRLDVRLGQKPPLRLSAIDIFPDHPQRTLVFLHGFGGQARQWQYQLGHFSSANRVIAPDLRGHGRSDRPRNGYHMPQILADFEGVLDALGVNEKIILAGHSFGGAVAAEFAAARPGRVERLALIATAGEYHLNSLYRLLLRLPARALQFLAPLTRGWLGAPPTVLKEWYEHNLSRWNGWSLFRGLELPTLVLRGHLDLVFRRPYYEEVARALPNAEELDLGASGHMVMLERREAVNRALARFISGETDGGRGSWRAAGAGSQENQREFLERDRPWLDHYDEGAPYTIAVPRLPLDHLLASTARRFPRRRALNFEGRRLTYSKLYRRAARFANALSSLGVQKGDRVMLILPNLPQLVIAFYGALKIGAVVVFSLPSTEPEELIRQVRDSGARVLVTLTQFDSLIYEIQKASSTGSPAQGAPGGAAGSQRSAAGGQRNAAGQDTFGRDGGQAAQTEKEPWPLEHILFTHIADYLPLYKRMILSFSPGWRKRHLLDIPLEANMHSFTRLLQLHNPEIGETPAAPRDLAVIIYTGGTTAAPKGVMLTHRNLMANAMQTRHWLPQAEEGRERFLCVVPFSHSYGLTASLNVPVALGAEMILKAQFQVEDVLKTIRRTRPTIFPGVPQMYVAISDFPGVRKYGIESIKACISGASPLAVETQEAFEKLTRGRLVEGYGLTEASPVTHANPLNGARKVGSIGIPLPSTEARIVDLKKGKRLVPAGQIGELAVRGPQVMAGYWKDPQGTEAVLSPDGWLLTGDVAQADAEGYYRIISRKADMWYPDKPGEPAFPRDVEEVLFEVPQVKEAAVVAIAGQPVAFVIVRQGRSRAERPTAESLTAYCKRRLPPELVPRLVIFVDEFPRTFIGKVLRRELARRFEREQGSREPGEII
jgi:long-chain acyl-CoA synthetase